MTKTNLERNLSEAIVHELDRIHKLGGYDGDITPYKSIIPEFFGKMSKESGKIASNGLFSLRGIFCKKDPSGDKDMTSQQSYSILGYKNSSEVSVLSADLLPSIYLSSSSIFQPASGEAKWIPIWEEPGSVVYVGGKKKIIDDILLMVPACPSSGLNIHRMAVKNGFCIVEDDKFRIALMTPSGKIFLKDKDLSLNFFSDVLIRPDPEKILPYFGLHNVPKNMSMEDPRFAKKVLRRNLSMENILEV